MGSSENDRQSYTITVQGCDDQTSVTLSLTAADAQVAYRIAEAVTEASDFGCMPTMSVHVEEDIFHGI